MTPAGIFSVCERGRPHKNLTNLHLCSKHRNLNVILVTSWIWIHLLGTFKQTLCPSGVAVASWQRQPTLQAKHDSHSHCAVTPIMHWQCWGISSTLPRCFVLSCVLRPFNKKRHYCIWTHTWLGRRRQCELSISLRKIGGKLEDFARALTFAMLKFPVKRQTFHPVSCHHGLRKGSLP